jgi:hypothetical protein
VRNGHVLNAEIAARELGSLSTSDALALVLLYQREGDPKFERAARRWVRRVQIDYSLRHREVELLRAAMGALGTRLGSVALHALLETCQKLRLPRLTLPPQPRRDDLYGIASALSDDIEDWYLSRDEAKATLAGILRDEPDFEGELWVEPVEFDQSAN